MQNLDVTYRASGPVYRARAGRVSYGVPIGILMLDCNVPFVPGDVGNASSYAFPVQFQVVRGASTRAVMDAEPELEARFVETARYLASQGVKALTGDCGYMAVYQRIVQEAVEIPVFLSSLFQLPVVLSMLRPDRKVAVVVADDTSVRPILFDSAGIPDAQRERLVVCGAQRTPHFDEVMMRESGELDVNRMEAEMAQLAADVVRDDPTIGAFLLECSDLPPYAAAMSRATGLPVFDWISFITWVQSAVNPRPYVGTY